MARDTQKLADGLRKWLPRGAGITGVTTLSAGHSNETYLIDGIDEVLRMPPSEEGLLPPYDMARQHEVLVAVSKGAPGIPLPPILELCTDPAVLGDEFFLPILHLPMNIRIESEVPLHLQSAATSEGACQ